MVKIYRRVCKRRYFSKAVYVYERFFVEVPRRFHELVRPFLDEELKVEVKADSEKLVIVLRKPR